MAVKPGYKQTEVGVIPEKWDVERLGELSEFVTSGSRGWAQFYSESGALFIRSQNVRDGRLSFEDVQYVSPPAGAEGNRTKVKLDDLLITITGNSVGNVALVEQTFDEAYISQHVGLVRLKEPTRGAYICRYLSPNSPGNPQIAGSQSGQSKPGLNLQNLRDFRIALPPSPKELRAIAGALSDVDALIGALDQLIAKKRDLKQAAMQQLLTGQTRLPGFHGEWQVKRFGEVATPRKERIDPRRNGVQEFCVELEHIEPATGNLLGSTSTGENASLKSVFREGDVLFGKLRAYLRKYWLADRPGVCSTEIWVFAPNPRLLTASYLFQLIKTDQFIEAASTAYGTHMPRSDWNIVKNYEFPLPPVPEQTAIAEVLWAKADYHFTLDWLLRSVNTALTGEAKFQFLHEKSAEEIQDGLKRATKHVDTCLNLIGGRLGLDHDQVFFGRFGVPVMVRYLDRRSGPMGEKERDKLLFWFVQAGMWGRFSGSTESFIDQDLAALEGEDGGLDKLLDQLRLWHGGLRVEPGHFTGWSLGARFYPVLYILTRMGEARDWGTGLPLKASLLGKMNRLEVHHIFPKARLYKRKFKRPEVNALGNFCFLTKDTNLDITDRLPEEYFPEVEKAHPGALASQWIPTDHALWKIENFREFLEARKALLATEVNHRMEELLHGETRWLKGPAAAVPVVVAVGSGISSEAEEEALEALNEWMEEQGLPRGVLGYDYADPATGEQRAVFDLAWPSGIQAELSQPVAVLLNESNETLAVASQAGYRCFTAIEDFQRYVKAEILVQAEPA